MRARRIAVAAAGLALVLGMAACQRQEASQGIATAGGAAPSTSAGGNPAGNAAANRGDDGVHQAGWVACLRAEGLDVSFPDPAIGDKPIIDESVGREKVQKATQACQRFNPNYGRKPPPMPPETLERWRQFAACLRANGVDAPDPDPNAARYAIPDLERGDPAGDLLVAALKACGDKVPGLVEIETGGPKKGG